MQRFIFPIIISLVVHLGEFRSTECKRTMLPIPENPFSYDLAVKVIPHRSKKAEITICCHGYGHSNQIVDVLGYYQVLPDHLIGFNFPDYGISAEADHRKSSYGSIAEILPLLYIMKFYACDVHFQKINLYGFSAGGGAIVNALAILNNHLYQQELQQIGISEDSINKVLSALEQGHIILDCPLKSMDEIIAYWGASPELEIVATQYAKNNMNPVDVLPLLSGLKLNILLHFQRPDEVLSNRDDVLFIERLKKANAGKTAVVISADGGHNTYHAGLWSYYQQNIQKN